MLSRLVNEARFTLRLVTAGPVLIKSGYPTMTGPDMTPVLTFRHGFPQVFFPGSSLKGMFRSHIEKVIRTLRPNDIVVADPFVKDGPTQSCGAWFTAENQRRKDQQQPMLDNPTIYKHSDPVARLFGSTSYSGRISIGDAYVIDSKTDRLLENASQNVSSFTEARDGVGIDRVTGGAANKAKFELEVISAGISFQTEVLVRNFECWQLGALLLVVQDIQEGLLRIGSGKSRGLGAITGTVETLSIHHIGRQKDRPSAMVWGLGHFLNNPKQYGTYDDDYLEITEAPAGEQRGIRHVQIFTGGAYEQFQHAAIQEFIKRMETFPAYQSHALENGV